MKKITLEKLAEMTQAGFQEMNKRFEAVDKRFEGVDECHRLFADQMNLMQADMHHIKITLGPMTRSVIALENDIRVLDLRMKRVEKKVGI